MKTIIVLLFHFSGFWMRASSLFPRQFYYVGNTMTWTDAQSYCKETYTDLVFVYSEDDIDQLNQITPTVYSYSLPMWIGGFSLIDDSENVTDITDYYCLAINMFSKKLSKKSCTNAYPFYCSRDEGRKVLLRIKVSSDKQLFLTDPAMKANILTEIKKKVDEQKFGNVIKTVWSTKQDFHRNDIKIANATCP